MKHLLVKSVYVSVIYTHIHKVSLYFAICGPPVDQRYVYHSGRRWTTDGLPEANLTIVLCNKIQNNYFWKIIHLKQMNLSLDSLFSRSVKTNAVQQCLRWSHQRTTIGPPTKSQSPADNTVYWWSISGPLSAANDKLFYWSTGGPPSVTKNVDWWSTSAPLLGAFYGGSMVA